MASFHFDYDRPWGGPRYAPYMLRLSFVIILSIQTLLNLLVVVLPACFKFKKIEENQSDDKNETTLKVPGTIKVVRSLMHERVVGVPESKVSTTSIY